MNKKGIFGLDTVKLVLVGLMILAILAVAMIFIVNTLQTTYEGLEAKPTSYISNETTTAAITTSSNVNLAAYTLRNPTCTITAVVNASNGYVFTVANNITQTNCQIKAAAGAAANNSIVKVTYSYTANSEDAYDVTSNVTVSPINFFKQIPTFFTLLGVVVLILVIAIVIIAVSRFQSPMVAGGSRMGSDEL